MVRSGSGTNRLIFFSICSPQLGDAFAAGHELAHQRVGDGAVGQHHHLAGQGLIFPDADLQDIAGPDGIIRRCFGGRFMTMVGFGRGAGGAGGRARRCGRRPGGRTPPARPSKKGRDADKATNPAIRDSFR